MELPGGAVQLTAEDSYISGRVKRQRHPVAGNSPNLQDDVIADMNPFTYFSTEHQHVETPCQSKTACDLQPGLTGERRCGRVVRLCWSEARSVP
jgi:hypothetical protein